MCSPAHWYLPPVVKKNHSLPPPPFHTCRNGLQGVPAPVRVLSPRIAFTGPVAISAFFGQKLSDFIAEILLPSQVGNFLALDTRP